jgi:RimJ/RimL family protein N-acetyltransferase
MIRRAIDHFRSSDETPNPDVVRSGDLADLRRHRPGDVDGFMRWYMDEEIATLLRHDLRPLTATQARGYFLSIVLPASAAGTAWAIHDRVSGNLIGTTAVTQIDFDKSSCLFRIVIGEKQAWGHGFGTDATRLVIAEVFETLGLDAIKLEVFGHNRRAQRSYEKVGFVETGRTVEWAGNRRLDVIAMELTRSRWGASSGSADRLSSPPSANDG